MIEREAYTSDVDPRGKWRFEVGDVVSYEWQKASVDRKFEERQVGRGETAETVRMIRHEEVRLQGSGKRTRATVVARFHVPDAQRFGQPRGIPWYTIRTEEGRINVPETHLEPTGKRADATEHLNVRSPEVRPTPPPY